MQERDYIGFDPIKWVDRLLDVSKGSSFTSTEKLVIQRELTKLRQRLELVKGVRP